MATARQHPPGPRLSTSLEREWLPGYYATNTTVSITKVYTPAAEIAQALRKAVSESPDGRGAVRPDSVEERTIGGRQALTWWVEGSDGGNHWSTYHAAIASESSLLRLQVSSGALVRWLVDPLIETIRLP
jgi:hypothetical protein